MPNPLVNAFYVHYGLCECADDNAGPLHHCDIRGMYF